MEVALRITINLLTVKYIIGKDSDLTASTGMEKKAAAFFPLLSFHFCYSNAASVLSSVVNCGCDDLPTVQGGVPARFYGLRRLRSTVGGVN